MQGCSLQQWLTDKENKMGPLLTKMGKKNDIIVTPQLKEAKIISFLFFFFICIYYKIVSFLNASFFYCSSVRLLNRYLYLFNYNLSRFKGDLKVRRINILQTLNDKHEKMMAL